LRVLRVYTLQALAVTALFAVP